MQRFEPTVVECYSGYKANDVPRKLTFKGKEYMVEEVIGRWYEGGTDSKSTLSENFKVKVSDDKGEYVLRHNVTSDTWEILW